MSSAVAFSWGEMVSLESLVASGEVKLGRGNVISKIDIQNNPGPYPIYSSSSKNDGKMGEYGDYMFDEEMISWSVDGGGYFFHRPKHKFSVTNVSGYMRLNSDWDYKFTAYSFQFQHGYFSFDYQTKAHPSVIREFYFLPKIPVAEQQKIATILSSVDDVIEKTRAQIDKLKDLKTGMMQELLTKGIGHTEFKDSPVGRIPAAWDVVELGSVVKLERGRFSHRPRNDPQFYGGNIPFLQTGDIPKEAPQITVFSQTLNEKGLSVSKLFPRGTLVLTIAATIGEIGILEFDSCFPDSLVGLKVNQAKVKPMFILYLMRHLKNELKSLAPQTAQKNINLDILQPFPIPLPSIGEQELIANSMGSVDDRVNVLLEKLERIKNTKKALMQDLLTGKVRVKPNESAAL